MGPLTPPATDIPAFVGVSTPQTELKHSKLHRNIVSPKRTKTPKSSKVLKLRTPPSSHHHKPAEETVNRLSKYVGSAWKARQKIESLANLVDQDEELFHQPDHSELQAVANTPTSTKTSIPTGLGIHDLRSSPSLSLHVLEPHTPRGQADVESRLSTPPPLIERSDFDYGYPRDIEGDGDEEMEITKIQPPNPFVNSSKFQNPEEISNLDTLLLINPFMKSPFNKTTSTVIRNNPRDVDYNTKVEYFDKRTGRYVEQDVTEEGLNVRPQRLTFGEEDDTNSKSTNYLIGGLKEFNKSRKHLGFHIFEDDSNRQ